MGALAALPVAVPAGTHFPWLSVVTFLPLAGAMVLALVPKTNLAAVRGWSLLVTLATFGVAVATAVEFKAGTAGFQLVERATWVGPLNFHYLLGVDGISLFLVVM